MSPEFLADLGALLAALPLPPAQDRALAVWHDLGPPRGRVLVSASQAARVAAVAVPSREGHEVWVTLSTVGGDLCVRCGRPGPLLLPRCPPAARVLHDAELAPLQDDAHARDHVWWETIEPGAPEAVAAALAILAPTLAALVVGRADLAGLHDVAARCARTTREGAAASDEAEVVHQPGIGLAR